MLPVDNDTCVGITVGLIGKAGDIVTFTSETVDLLEIVKSNEMPE